MGTQLQPVNGSWLRCLANERHGPWVKLIRSSYAAHLHLHHRVRDQSRGAIPPVDASTSRLVSRAPVVLGLPFLEVGADRSVAAANL